MNFMDIVNNRFSSLSCDEIRKEKKELEREIKKRQDKRIQEINLEYKEKERILRSRFDALASELGCTIPTEFKLSKKVKMDLFDTFISISRKYNTEYGYPREEGLSNEIENDITWIIAVLSQETNYNIVLSLAQKLELNNLEYSRLSDISKVKEDI